jgi:hypothetical protein
MAACIGVIDGYEQDLIRIAIAESIYSDKMQKEFDNQLKNVINKSIEMSKLSNDIDIINPMVGNNRNHGQDICRKHIDFIIGRGRIDPKSYMNFPLNPRIKKRNIIYIDPNDMVDAHIKKYLHEVDFSKFGIHKNQDPLQVIDVRFIFDWSSFYCGGLQFLPEVMGRIDRKCHILVPLNIDEESMPSEIKRCLFGYTYTLTIAEGKYPLFDWSNKEFHLSQYMNPNRYILIHVYL